MMDSEESIYKYDKYILSLSRKLNWNTLCMNRDDLLQFGREEVVHALRDYKIDKAKDASESYFVKNRLKWRFFNLLTFSVGRTSNLGKSVLRRAKYKGLNFENAREVEVDFNEMISNRTEDTEYFDNTVYFNQVIDKLNKNPQFAASWKTYKECSDDIYELNKQGKHLTKEYRDAHSKYKQVEALIYKIVKSKMKFL